MRMASSKASATMEISAKKSKSKQARRREAKTVWLLLTVDPSTGEMPLVPVVPRYFASPWSPASLKMEKFLLQSSQELFED